MMADIFSNVHDRGVGRLWLLLGFQAGFMNAGGYLACHRFVSHVTGYGTQVGIVFGLGQTLRAMELGLAPAMFIAGAACAGWLVDREILSGREPRLLAGIFIMATMNLAVYLGGVWGVFGPFGEPLELQRDFLLLFFLCFACGLQNGLFTGLTKGQVRTTHITGPSTDIGLGLAKVASLGRDDPRRAEVKAATWLRTRIAAAFTVGSLTATAIFSWAGYGGFAVPCGLSGFLVWYVRKLMWIGAAQAPAPAVSASSGTGPRIGAGA